MNCHDLLNRTVGKLLESKDLPYVINHKENHEHLKMVIDKLHIVGCVLLDIAITDAEAGKWRYLTVQDLEYVLRH